MKAPTTAGRCCRTARSDIVVALLLLGGCAIVIYDSVRLGFNWREGEGPAPGYFPFYIALILGVSSLINLVGRAARARRRRDLRLARPFGRVLAVLIPSLVYVAYRRHFVGPSVPGSASMGFGHLHHRASCSWSGARTR